MLSTIVMAASMMVQAAPATASGEGLGLSYDFTTEQLRDIRCGSVFGIVTGAQDRGEAYALAYPKMEPDAKKFFFDSFERIGKEVGISPEQMRTEYVKIMKGMQLMGKSPEEMRPAVAPYMKQCLPLLKAKRFRDFKGAE